MPSVPTCARRVLRSEETAQVSYRDRRSCCAVRGPLRGRSLRTSPVIADEYGSSPQSDL